VIRHRRIRFGKSFANLNGTISAWNGGSTAVTQVTTPGAGLPGLILASGGLLDWWRIRRPPEHSRRVRRLQADE
jgi:hypothetical protein